mmetsp:Transcript_63329/g.73697  ORF Transcript_63329/g.73697 Transcript_63329/m.73697 type:complete len:88 (+) Transcript_63329:49-312(+)
MADRVAGAAGNLYSKKSADVLYNPEDSFLAPFFGSNTPGPKTVVTNEHMCAAFSQAVNRCLDDNNNKFEFCQPVVARFELCLREERL